MRCHLVVPTVSHVEVGRGGLNHYRGVALALASLLPTTVHQPLFPLPHKAEWNTPGVPVRSWRTSAALLAELDAGTASDIVIKYAGAFGVQTDAELDAGLLELRDRKGFRLIYADPDGPHRLPLLRRGMNLPWARFDEIWCFQGGQRAVAEYAELAPGAVVRTAPFGVSALPALVAGAPSDWDDRPFDLLVTVGAASAREERLTDVLTSMGPLRIAVVGDVPHLGECHPPRDPHDLLELYAKSRFTLNLLRDECRGYPDVPACRLFEAAATGSVPVTEEFDGLAGYFPPGAPVLRLGDDLGTATAEWSTRARSCAERIASNGVADLRALLLVPAEEKNRRDAGQTRRRVVHVDVNDRAAAAGVRWVPGRDVAVPDDSGWPWLTAEQGEHMAELVHVVLLNFRPDTTGEEREEFLARLDALLHATPTATNYAFGLDTGQVADSDHYDVALHVTFPDLDEYLAYEKSAAHDAFVEECASKIVIGRATAQFWSPR